MAYRCSSGLGLPLVVSKEEEDSLELGDLFSEESQVRLAVDA